MGDDREISESESKELAKSKELFLTAEIIDEPDLVPSYALGDEFSSSRKNRNTLFYLLLLGFLGILAAGTFAASWYIQQKDLDTEVRITDFQDLNLKKLLESSRGEAKNLKLARKELERLKKAKTNALKALTDTSTKKREAILSSKKPRAEIRKAISQERAYEQKKREAINTTHDPKIDTQEERVAALEKSVADSGRRMREGVEKAEGLVNNYDRLHKLRMQRQKEFYENQISKLTLRYNPHYSNRKIRSILRKRPAKAPKSPPSPAYRKELKKSGVSRSEFNNIRNNRNNLLTLIRRMRRTPYKNSVSPALTRMDAAARASAAGYERLWSRTAETLKRNNQSLNAYRYSLEYLSKVQPESGYVLDPRNSRKVRLYMKRVLNIRGGDRGRIFRNDNEFIAQIEFLPNTKGRLAKVVLRAPGKKIRPFDRILVSFKKSRPAPTPKPAPETEEKKK